MRTELNNSSTGLKNATQSLENPGFDQMAQSLSHAISEFSEQSPAILASIVGALRPAWNTTSSYVRRHPVRIAVSVVALGFIAAQLMRPKTSSAPASADGRQY